MIHQKVILNLFVAFNITHNKLYVNGKSRKNEFLYLEKCIFDFKNAKSLNHPKIYESKFAVHFKFLYIKTFVSQSRTCAFRAKYPDTTSEILGISTYMTKQFFSYQNRRIFPNLEKSACFLMIPAACPEIMTPFGPI